MHPAVVPMHNFTFKQTEVCFSFKQTFLNLYLSLHAHLTLKISIFRV